METSGVIPGTWITAPDLADIALGDGPFATVQLALDAQVENASQRNQLRWKDVRDRLAEQGTPENALVRYRRRRSRRAPRGPDADRRRRPVRRAARQPLARASRTRARSVGGAADVDPGPPLAPGASRSCHRGRRPHGRRHPRRAPRPAGHRGRGRGAGRADPQGAGGRLVAPALPAAGRGDMGGERPRGRRGGRADGGPRRRPHRRGRWRCPGPAGPAERAVGSGRDDAAGGRRWSFRRPRAGDRRRRSRRHPGRGDRARHRAAARQAGGGAGPAGRASEGIAATVGALAMGQVEVLLLHDDPEDGRMAWFGPEPVHVATSPEDLRAMGVDDPQRGRLGDVLVRAALGTGAGVRILVDAQDLTDGVGAVLRWS